MNAIIAAAPAVGTGSLLRVIFGPKNYALASGLTAFQDKNIELRGVYGKNTPDGTSNGTRLVATSNNIVLMTVGDGSNVYHNGPLIENINFSAGTRTGVTGLKIRSTNHGRYNLLSFHACRHGFATELLRAGVDVVTVAKLGGWRSAAQVLQTYGHSLDDLTLTDRLIDTPTPDKAKTA